MLEAGEFGTLLHLEANFSAPGALEYTPEVAEAVRPIYERLSHVIPEIEWPIFAPYVKAIYDVKREKNAVILAHNYMTPEIFHGVADIVVPVANDRRAIDQALQIAGFQVGAGHADAAQFRRQRLALAR